MVLIDTAAVAGGIVGDQRLVNVERIPVFGVNRAALFNRFVIDEPAVFDRN